ADGTWLRTVTRSSTSSWAKSSVPRAVRSSTTTTVPPVAQAPHISHTEKSKLQEWNNVQRSEAPTSNSGSAASNNASTLPLVTRQPFGRPVEPEVKMTYAGRLLVAVATRRESGG